MDQPTDWNHSLLYSTEDSFTVYNTLSLQDKWQDNTNDITSDVHDSVEMFNAEWENGQPLQGEKNKTILFVWWINKSTSDESPNRMRDKEISDC